MMRTLVLLALLLVATALALLLGQVPLSVGALWQGLAFGDGPAALTVRVLRAPRVMTALGAGASLGLAGAIFQSLFKNPLASPDVMGFTAGSGLAILAAITAGLALPLPVIAAVGGVAAALLVAFAAGRPDEGITATPALTVVLVGLGVGFTATAINGFLMTRLSGPEAAEAQRWLAGSLSARDFGHGVEIMAIGGALALCLVPQVRALRLLELGPDLAMGLGLSLARARYGLAATGIGFAAAAVAVAGPIAFVALMAPPVGARLLRASDPGARLAAAAGAGAIITVLADLAARALVPGLVLPIGIMTGILGAPYLLWRLSREMERGDL
ncbi:FecCD family ABC transporter permease [Acuticoccus mangrovi]|uniref:Iron ABC transporter permease n=1 Tax=Acuticoccus mangrovi TaxID=2796142 RepID=A0A934IUA2_9HYPH|nr:iron ABC transporter permease [Acuticoccus mangrovi]MBJ3778718.1 iron ABC transporter permease [Acuticoccus mangrovi]